MFSFEGFLRIDRALRAMYRLAYLNLLWSLVTLSGLVVVGIGPASYALARYLDGWVRHGETPPPTKAFFQYVGERPLRSMSVGWVLLGAGAVIVTNVFLAPNWYFQFFNVVALCALGVVAAYVFPLMSAIGLESHGRLFAAALLVGLGSLHWTILAATASAVVLYALWQVAPLLAGVFGFGVPALAFALVTKSVLRELTPEAVAAASPAVVSPLIRRFSRPATSSLTTQATTKGLAR